MSNPNPQPVAFAAYEAPRLTVTMTPAADITGATFELNIRTPAQVVVLQSTTFTVTSLSAGIFYFTLTSAQTGTTIGVGDYRYDIWRTDSGNEKRLCYGPLAVEEEQWQ